MNLTTNPVYSGPDTVLASKEIISAAVIHKGIGCEITVPKLFTGRRIYLWIDTKTTNDYNLHTMVRTWINGSKVDEFPVNLFSNANATLSTHYQSYVSCFAAGGTAVGDSIVLQLAGTFTTGVNNVVLQPLRIDSVIDKITWEVDNFEGAIQGVRAWLGCMSTRN